ncbi:hypothetical protein MYP14_04720 [Rhodococcus pyridinivorans]|uniref:hypothetical protein n=1 Tax=Rhodococcus pyridinivorans TaxID=103816 RepID=UPI001FFF6408|nr:hypothetical protein [Rhodococcus pyridinivorans]UPK64670.1 hypothetical protein MYP14_04720 [Rhodococcus pyridinivorans]
MPTIAENLAALQSAALRGESVDVAAYAKAKAALDAEKLLTEAQAAAAADHAHAEHEAAKQSADQAHQAHVQALIDRARKA